MKKKTGKKKNKRSDVERTAYLMGQVSVGLKNPNSRIAETHAKGAASASKKKEPRKPLF